MEDALKEVFNSDAKLLVFGDKERDSFRNKGKTVSSMDFNPQFTFDNFVVGPSNRFAHSASIAVSKNPGQVYNPLFIYGPSGVGKTHLLYAIANGIRRQNPEANIVYIKGDEFTNELISAIASGKMWNSAANTGKVTCFSSMIFSLSPVRNPPRRSSSTPSISSTRNTSRSS